MKSSKKSDKLCSVDGPEVWIHWDLQTFVWCSACLCGRVGVVVRAYSFSWFGWRSLHDFIEFLPFTFHNDSHFYCFSLCFLSPFRCNRLVDRRRGACSERCKTHRGQCHRRGWFPSCSCRWPMWWSNRYTGRRANILEAQRRKAEVQSLQSREKSENKNREKKPRKKARKAFEILINGWKINLKKIQKLQNSAKITEEPAGSLINVQLGPKAQ